MKQLAPMVLAIWLASWAIVTLKPCCESILASSQSHHNTENNHHTDGHSEHHNVAATHQHDSVHDCRIATENIDDLTAPVTDTYLANYELDAEADTLPITSNASAHSDNSLLSYSYHHTHPPPGQSRLYLQTQRIRV